MLSTCRTSLLMAADSQLFLNVRRYLGNVKQHKHDHLSSKTQKNGQHASSGRYDSHQGQFELFTWRGVIYMDPQKEILNLLPVTFLIDNRWGLEREDRRALEDHMKTGCTNYKQTTLLAACYISWLHRYRFYSAWVCCSTMNFPFTTMKCSWSQQMTPPT